MELTDKILELYIKPYQEKIVELEKALGELKSKQSDDYQTANINDLAASFAKAQGDLKARKAQWRIAIKREIVTIQHLINEIWP